MCASPCCPHCNVEYDVAFRVNFEHCFLLAVLHLLIHHNPSRHDTETTTTVRHVRWQSRTTPPNMTYSQLRSHSPPFYNPLREVRHHERCKLRRLGRLIRGLRRRRRRRGEVSDLEILHVSIWGYLSAYMPLMYPRRSDGDDETSTSEQQFPRRSVDEVESAA
jgi:hypothetical protein